MSEKHANWTTRVSCPASPYVRHAVKTVVIFTHDLKSVCRPVGCRVCVASYLLCHAPSHVTVEHLSSSCCTVKSDSNRVAAASPPKSEDVPYTACCRSMFRLLIFTSPQVPHERDAALIVNDSQRCQPVKRFEYMMARWNSSNRCRFTFRQISKSRIFKHLNLFNKRRN